jgi:hypothetical protein
VHKVWPIAGVPGELTRELPTPKYFEQTASLLTEAQTTEGVACGNDPQKHLEAITTYLDAGFRKVAVHNVGPNQEEFFKFYKENIIPKIKNL